MRNEAIETTATAALVWGTATLAYSLGAWPVFVAILFAVAGGFSTLALMAWLDYRDEKADETRYENFMSIQEQMQRARGEMEAIRRRMKDL